MNSRKSFHREVKMMIAEGFTCQRYGFNVGADKFSLLTIENGKTSIMRLSEWTLISQSQKSHSDRLLVTMECDTYGVGDAMTTFAHMEKSGQKI